MFLVQQIPLHQAKEETVETLPLPVNDDDDDDDDDDEEEEEEEEEEETLPLVAMGKVQASPVMLLIGILVEYSVVSMMVLISITTSLLCVCPLTRPPETYTVWQL
jgi:hypothetical protein